MSANTHPMVVAVAKALVKRHAEVCNVNDEDLWLIEGEFFIEEAQIALDACAAPELLTAAEKALAECADLIGTPAGAALEAAIAKATGSAQ